MMDINEIVHLDLFSGIGGFSKGFLEAGFGIKTHYFSEIDNHAIANYKYNFPNAKYVGSVTNVRGTDLERPNIITFGSPCQDFSLAGKRTGMDGQRSSLISEAIRLISECRPNVFVWENVKGAFSSNNGKDFWAIIQAFANIGGYRLEWQLLNTSWVLPQNRERIYLVGHLAESGRNFRPVFPISESYGRIDERATETTNVRCLTAGGHSGGHHSGMTLIKSIVNRGHGYFKGSESTKYSPTLNAKSSRDNLTVHVAHVSRTDEAKEIRKQNMKNGKDYTPFQAKKLEFKDSNVMNTITCATQKDNLIQVKELDEKFRFFRNDEKKSGIQGMDIIKETAKNSDIVDNHPKNIISNERIRRLTEIECERLQGFPDNWTKFGNYNDTIKEVPKTQRYKMCGNSVTVAIVKMIAERLR